GATTGRPSQGTVFCTREPVAMQGANGLFFRLPPGQHLCNTGSGTQIKYRESMIPNTLSIAGVDPSGGAGVLADVKAMSALGAYATAVIAALTAQNTQGVTGICPVPVD